MRDIVQGVEVDGSVVCDVDSIPITAVVAAQSARHDLPPSPPFPGLSRIPFDREPAILATVVIGDEHLNRISAMVDDSDGHLFKSQTGY